MGHKNIGECVLLVQRADYLFSLNPEQLARSNRARAGHAHRLGQGDALFPAKIPRAQQRHGRFFTCLGQDAQPDPAALNIKNALSSIALGKGVLFGIQMNHGSAQAGLRKKGPRIKVTFFLKRDFHMDSSISPEMSSCPGSK
jgi:hypothetical protein